MAAPGFFILLAGILLLLFAACMLTGAVWLFFGWRKKSRSTQFLSAVPFGVGLLIIGPLMLLALIMVGLWLIADWRSIPPDPQQRSPLEPQTATNYENRPARATQQTNNMTPEQFAELFKQERRKAGAWFAALDAAKPSAPYIHDFQRLFPGATVNYRYFTSTGEPGFNAEVDLFNRYELTMQLPVLFDPEGRTVTGYGEPEFWIVETTAQNGRETLFNPNGERHFGSAEWNKIVESGGDFSAIGYHMITNRPVAGFHSTQNNP